MNKRRLLLGVGGFLLAGSLFASQGVSDIKPNIVFILADDLGFADVGFNGQQKIKTPNLDQMAKDGMVFSDFYSGSAVCGPSRATLMSGRHTGHCKIRTNPRWIQSGETIDFDENDQTLGKVIKSAGYACGYFGKWGLNENLEAGTGHPLKQGFDEFWGFNTHREAHYHWPEYYWHNYEKVVVAEGKTNWNQKKVYADDVFTEKAIDFINDNAGNTPFFAFLGYTIPHTGISAPKSSWKQYENLGWPKRKGKVGHYRDDPDVNISYAAMISHMDAYIGQLKEALERKGVLDNTLIFFTSDNGHYKSSFFESGGEFKGGKMWLWEGGIRMPAVVTWPGKIEAGSVMDQPFALWDIMATFAELAGAETPENDGISFVPALLGREQKNHDYLYWEFNERNGPMQAIRFAGKWKAYRAWDKKAGSMGPIQLHDLKTDPGETKNLAASNPELAQRAEQILETARTPDAAFPLTPKGQDGQKKGRKKKK